jgi:hypothetical protein
MYTFLQRDPWIVHLLRRYTPVVAERSARRSRSGAKQAEVIYGDLDR